MDKAYDIIIVGGGPAGSATGVTLLRRGYSVLIIDKAEFPRQKLCGGLITQKTLDLVNEIFGNEVCNRIVINKLKKVAFYERDIKITQIGIDIPLYLTDRELLDNQLLNIFKSEGGEVLENVYLRTRQINSDNTLSLHGELIKFKFLIGADGALSQVRNLIDKKYRPESFCLENNLALNGVRYEDDIIIIMFGHLQSGYSWLFPKINHYTIGMGGLTSKKITYPEAYRLLAKDLEIQLVKPGGFYIPTGQPLQKPYSNQGILLVGDAAGLVDPITGEGIYYALFSGQKAGEAIHRFLSLGAMDAGKIYKKSLAQVYQSLRHAKNYRKIFYRPMVLRAFLRHLNRRSGLAKYYLDNTMSTNNVSYKYIIFNYLYHKIKLRRSHKKQDL